MEEPKQPLVPFERVPVRARSDGWTVKKQYAFIEALAESGDREHCELCLSGLFDSADAKPSSSLRRLVKIGGRDYLKARSRLAPKRRVALPHRLLARRAHRHACRS